MDQSMNVVPKRLQEIIEEFEYSEGREKIELLLDYAGRMPALPETLADKRAGMDLVEECMTPVYVASVINDDHMTFYFDVPEESPTVRGFAAIMAAGLDGATPEEVLRVPNDFFSAMGLESILTMQRLNGFSAILAHMKRLSAQAIKSRDGHPGT